MVLYPSLTLYPVRYYNYNCIIKISVSMTMERWLGKVAFVTGGSAGMGYDLSKRLCELGMNVVGCARNVGKIEVSADCTCSIASFFFGGKLNKIRN